MSELVSRFKSFVIHSVSFRATVTIFACCLLMGVSGALFFSHSQQDFVINRVRADLNQASERHSELLAAHLGQLVAVAKSANKEIGKSLNKPAPVKEVVNQLSDGSFRSLNSTTGGFLASHNQLTAENRALFDKTSLVFNQIGPLIRESFFNFYFIGKQDFIRITPPDWATEVDGNHNFAEDIFYKIATPEINPSRKPVWTPVYYDDIWNKWMTSLIVPVYQNDEFIGVTGSDFVLEQLTRILNAWVEKDRGRDSFIFDTSGNIISHPSYSDLLSMRTAKMNSKLNSSDLMSEPLRDLVSKVLKKKGTEFEDDFIDQGEHYFVSVKPVANMGWYLAVFESVDKTEAYLKQFERRMTLGAVLLAVMLSVLIYVFFNRTLLARLRTLAKSVDSYQQGELDIGGEKLLDDEVATVAKAMTKMTSEINGLIRGLNEKIDEKELAELAALKLSNAVKYSETAIAIINEDFRIEYINPKFSDITDKSEADLLGEKIQSVFDEQMVWVLDSAYDQLRRGMAWKGELLISRGDKDTTWVSQTFSPMMEAIQGKTHYVSASQDISFIKQSQRKMEKLAYHDPLTGLYNRTFFKAQLTKALEMTRRGHYAFSLFYFDLDQFKRINDTLGHDAGDELLVTIANRLTSRLRTEDTMARLGGDEFAIILSGVGEEDRAAAIALDVQSLINEPIPLSGAEVLVSASIGITMAPKDTSSIESLLRNADLAMYRAKASGRSTYYFFNEALDKAAQESLLLESELRDALEKGQFELYYQPQIKLDSGELFGFEALLRWVHPERGMVSPGLFIPVAEQSGLIVKIGEWVINEACEFAQQVNKRFDQELTVAINLSARQFKDKELINKLKNAIIHARVQPHLIDVELTETMLMGDVNDAIQQMKDIKKLGVQLSIDDFGTGYSSLNYLKKFPVDTLKVDRAFVKDIPNEKDDMAIAAAIIAMAHKLKLNVIAEGIEEPEQVDFLADNACQIGQGYLFSKPLPKQNLLTFVTDYKAHYQGSKNHLENR